MTANIKCTAKQTSKTFCETNIPYRLALIYSACSLSLKFEP